MKIKFHAAHPPLERIKYLPTWADLDNDRACVGIDRGVSRWGARIPLKFWNKKRAEKEKDVGALPAAGEWVTLHHLDGVSTTLVQIRELLAFDSEYAYCSIFQW